MEKKKKGDELDGRRSEEKGRKRYTVEGDLTEGGK